MNILILDDMKIRHEKFKLIFHKHNLFHAYTFKQAQDIISISDNKIEMACLDHDLGDEDIEIATSYYDEYGRKKYYNGADFAYWLSNQERSIIPNKVLIHSWNTVGAQTMKRYLEKVNNPKIDILVKEFGSK